MKNTFTEIHLHTSETSSCGQVSATVSIPAYKEYGYDCVIVTDHYNADYFPEYYEGTFTWEQAVDQWLLGYHTAKEIGEKIGLKVLLGAEFRFPENWNDYLVFGLSEEDFYKYPALFELGPEGFSKFAKEHGLYFSQAHPFRDGMHRCNPDLLDGIEVFNSHPHHDSHNIDAINWCNEHGKIPTCGSDYHQLEALQGCGMNFHGEINSIQDVVDKLFARDYDLVIPAGYVPQLIPR